MDQALAGQNASQPVREEWLDPTELHPVHQALVDQVSKQRGPRVHRLSPFMERAKAGMDSRAILFDSYDRKTKAAEAEVAMTLDPTLQYAAQGLPTPAELIGAGMGVQPPGAPSGGPAGVQPPDAPEGGPLGAPAARPTAQTVSPAPLGHDAYDRLSQELSGIQRPQYPGEAPLHEPELLKVIGSSVLAYLTKQPGLATLPLQAEVYDQQRRTKEGQVRFSAESHAVEDRIATLERMLGVQSTRDVNDATRADRVAIENAQGADRMALGTYAQDEATRRAGISQEGQNLRAGLRADSSAMNTLLRQAFGADSPEARLSAATTLKTRFGFDVYDPQSLATLQPSERVAVERARSLAEKRPLEIAEIVARTGLTKERAALVHKQVEHFEEGLRIKAAMLEAYLANIDSMIAERARRPEVAGAKEWNDRLDANVKAAQSALEDLKKRRERVQDDLREWNDGLRSNYYTEEADKKFAGARVETLTRELGQLDEQIGIAEADLQDAKGNLPGPPVDPQSVDPGLKGPIVRAGRGLRSQANPYDGLV